MWKWVSKLHNRFIALLCFCGFLFLILEIFFAKLISFPKFRLDCGAYVHYLFKAFDVNNKGTISFRVCVLRCAFDTFTCLLYLIWRIIHFIHLPFSDFFSFRFAGIQGFFNNIIESVTGSNVWASSVDFQILRCGWWWMHLSKKICQINSCHTWSHRTNSHRWWSKNSESGECKRFTFFGFLLNWFWFFAIDSQVDYLFRKFDLNRDGVITIDEFIEACLNDNFIVDSIQIFDKEFYA